LLDLADECEDPYLKMVYASEFMHIFEFVFRKVFIQYKHLTIKLVCHWTDMVQTLLFCQHHGQFLYIKHTRGLGSLSILFLGKLMKWSIMEG